MATTSSLSALELYVSPAGDDAAAGTKDAPFLTPAHARDHVRKSSALGKEPVTVHLAAGTYYLPEALRLTLQTPAPWTPQSLWQGESEWQGHPQWCPPAAAELEGIQGRYLSGRNPGRSEYRPALC